MAVAAVFLAHYLAWQNSKPPVNTDPQPIEPTKDWDEEWLRQVNREHSLSAIEPCMVVFTFGNPGKPKEGMKWVCICGASKGCGTLHLAELSFNMHLGREKDKALAAIGRFK